MSSPPAKKKKPGHVQQLTLFGGIATGQAIHKTPGSVYERFVDAFVIRNLHEFSSRAEPVKSGQEQWRKIRDVKGKAEEFSESVNDRK